MSLFTRERTVAMSAVRSASLVCRNVQATIAPETLEKKDRSPVTIADYASQAIVCHAIREAFPDDPIIAEEDAAELRQGENSVFVDRIVEELGHQDYSVTGEEVCGWIDEGHATKYSDRFWTLDPIDGTKGFLRGGQYAVALALIVNGQVELAVLGCPNLPFQHGSDAVVGTIMVAARGAGTMITAIDQPEASAAVMVSTTIEPDQFRLCESVESGHSSHGTSARFAERLGITAEPVRMDSQAKYAAVARGDADIYLRLPTRQGYVERIWDHAAGVLAVLEGGGTVTDLDGKPIDFTHGAGLERNRGIVATNGRAHEKVLETLSAVQSEAS
ncbi:3'(2'),5'-bisphosphate nucleotidase [Calycomorphotria hydatis]|uniref:3'(2'),5'-bisphosphate nucleotidase n=1 Tax=Calycomorphotria hydatis TaxID=2528027 RepID=A0A517TBC2_9PLAN|nr:3'(2'),5'-bisphosphate nucleotidase [Calycomorphotria hydatis]QDT65666.1 3'(2'),5'-bisphosphate nucleotidase CysQ [Calycomorphotria hydatis]